MITDKDWQEVVAKCQAVSKPNETAHILLAAATYMLERQQVQETKHDTTVGYSGDSEFASVVRGKNPESVLSVFEELMDTLSALSPKLYNAVMNKLKGRA